MRLRIYFKVTSGLGFSMPHTLWLSLLSARRSLFSRRLMFLYLRVSRWRFCSSGVRLLKSGAFIPRRVSACSPMTSMGQLLVKSAKVTLRVWVMLVSTIFLQWTHS